MFITNKQKFCKLQIKIPQNINSGSQKKIEWICDCGKETNKSIYNVLNNKTTSCGKCNLITAEEISKRKFGKLRIKISQDILPGSNKKTEWICDCSNEINARIDHVISEHTTSCGKCNLITAEEISKRRFGKLRIKESQDILPGSAKKIKWICDCGKEINTSICSVFYGFTKTCGKCNLTDQEISKIKYGKNNIILSEEMAVRKFGKLRIKYSKNVTLGSNKKIEWICDCGKEVLTTITNVVNSHTISCGKCDLVTAEEMAVRKFGRLQMKYPKDTKPGSHEKEEWVCDCGKTTYVRIEYCFTKKTTSCGHCSELVQNWYLINKEKIKLLKCPVTPENFIIGGPIPLETIKNTYTKFKTKCIICNNIYYPVLDSIKRGVSLTCGCSYNRVSLAQKEITEFIKLFGLEVINEYDVNGLKYDIFVPSHNLLIEYNGLKWHSYLKSKDQDMNKHKLAIENGYNYLMVFEDEWIFNRSKVESLIKNKLGIIKSQSIRSNKCEIKLISSQKVNLFYDQFHYIGKCHPKLSYGVYYNSQLIAAISFSKPTRQTSKYDYELVRMSSDSEFRVHGIWNKLLKKFIKEYNPKSIVSFSDSRLFSGAVYEKIGFKFDGEIPSDYYWVKGNKRFHKSALRKTKEEKLTGLTETRLREAQGYKKIWDLGKKRWVLIN